MPSLALAASTSGHERLVVLVVQLAGQLEAENVAAALVENLDHGNAPGERHGAEKLCGKMLALQVPFATAVNLGWPIDYAESA